MQQPTNPSENTQKKKQTQTKQIALLGLFTALALGIYGIECAIPNPIPIPGIKLGLANIITLIVLSRYRARQALLVLLARLLLSSFLFGQFVSLLYALTGGLLCLLAEVLTQRLLRKKGIYISAMFGALFHNLGQLLVALFLTAVPGVLAYIPYLTIAGILTGLFTGLCAHFSLKLLPSSVGLLPQPSHREHE